MQKYTKDVNETTGLCGQVGIGTDAEYYQSHGFELRDIEQAYNGWWYLAGYAPVPPEPVVTMKDYDDAMEAHLLAERSARGYTTREPSPYYDDSANARWKQDAADWKAHRDAVMEYALQVENDYAEGKPVPTLAEFKELLPKIQWTINAE